MQDQEVLLVLAAALDAASAALRERVGKSQVGANVMDAPGQPSVAMRARSIHPRLGPRQIRVIELLEEAGQSGTDTGVLSRQMRYDRSNVYLTLQSLPEGFVEKDTATQPQTYRLGAVLAAWGCEVPG